ncbi:hypothetical protein P3342_007307 [Pyrenophora teres f. teres]|nr:hypothetical protein P3342_007307 [Pyrenophora teres f. teres]
MTTSVNFTEVDQGNQYYLDRRYNSNGRKGPEAELEAFQKANKALTVAVDSSHAEEEVLCLPEGRMLVHKPQTKSARLPVRKYEGIEHTSQYNQRGWKEEEDCEDDDNDDGTGEQQYFEQQFFKEQCLADQAFLHHISGDDIYGRGAPSAPASQFLLEDRYTRSLYQGILRIQALPTYLQLAKSSILHSHEKIQQLR